MPGASANDAPPLRKLLAANTTFATAFATPFALTDLTGSLASGVAANAALIDLGGDPGPANLMLRFFGTAAATKTGEARVSGVRRGSVLTGAVYPLVPLGSYTFTLSTMAGNAHANCLDTDLIANAIARLGGIGTDAVTDTVFSPTGNVPGCVILPRRGHRFVLVELRLGTTTPAASVNAEWCGVP